MKTNIHTPERLAGEPMAEYHDRRKQSRLANAKTLGLHLRGGTGSRLALRDSMRANGTMGKRIRAYAALMEHFAKQRKLGNIKHALA